MEVKRPVLPKSLKRTGFLKSAVTQKARATWGYSQVHVPILTRVLRNWLLPVPVNAVMFDVVNLRFREQLNSLFQVVKNDGSIYRPSGYGIAVMVLLSVEGSTKFANYCANAYRMLRHIYLSNPENASIELADFRTQLELDELLAVRVLCILADVGACSQPVLETQSRIYITPNVRDKADIWSVFEGLMPAYSGSQPLSYNFGTLGTPPEPSHLDAAHNVIGMCPEALDDWQKAHERLMRDPAGAITSARSMLESAIKWIHHRRQAEPPSKDGSTGRRIKDCIKLLGGEGNDFDKPGIRPMIAGLENAVNGLDAARNSMGDGHGKSPDAPQANTRIARLVVGLASTLTIFLMATYESRQRP